MTARAKGNRNELRAEKELVECDWIVQRAGYRRFAQNDFWGVGDILAIKKGYPIKLVQVKSNRLATPSERKALADFGSNYNIQCEIWSWYDREGWRKCYWMGDAWVCKDERKHGRDSVMLE